MSFFAQSSQQEMVFLDRLRQLLTEEPYTGIPTEPSQILPHVYIGNQKNASSLRLLRQLGVTHVLNCAGFKGARKPSEQGSPYEGLGIDYLEFKAEDKDTYDIRRHFGEAFSYLDRVKRKGGICLVHCAMGINRSGATCIAYLMAHRNMPLLQATRVLKEKRRVVLANRGFQKQLMAWARTRGLLDKDITETASDTLDSNRKQNACEYMASSFLDRSREARRFTVVAATSAEHSPKYPYRSYSGRIDGSKRAPSLTSTSRWRSSRH